MSRNFIALFLLSIAFSLQSYAKSNLRFTHYTTRDGLSNNITTALFQDSRGLLWVGTSNGLNYFDGVSFQTIYPTDFDKVHLHSDGISRIVEDAQGNILFITDDGLAEYNWNTKSLRLIFLKNFNGCIYDVKTDKNKNIWLLSKNYLQEYSPQWKLNKIIRIDTLEKKADKDGGSLATFFCIDNTKNVWFHYHGMVCEWKAKTNKLENKLNNPKKIFKTFALDIIQDANEVFWVTEKASNVNALCKYYPETDSIQVCLSATINQLGYESLSNSGNIFITSLHHGLYIFNTANKTTQIIHHKNSDFNSPVDDYFNAVYRDKDNNIWLASQYGLDKCTDISNKFFILNNFGYDIPLTTSAKTVIDNITAYKKDLLVGTTGGFFRVNTDNLKIQCFKQTETKYTFKDNFLLSCFMNDSTLLTVTWKGMYFFKLDKKKLHPLQFSIPHPALMDSVPAVSSFEDSKKCIWLGMLGNNGIYCWNKNTNNFVKYDNQQTGNHYFPLHHFSYAAEDDEGNIWMGYNKGGMTIFDVASQKFIQPSFSAFKQLNENVIHDIINDHRGNLWISTSRGLFCYTLKTGNLKQYNRTDGLTSNVVMGMAFDKKGLLWMGTYSGLSKFDTTAKQFTNFTAADGLPDDWVDQVIYDSATNKICFTTTYTVGMFDPSKLTKNFPVLSPVISSFSIMGKQESLGKSINLSYKQNFFSFNYTAPNFTNAADVRYEYKLTGFNKTWVNAGKRHYTGYTNLDGGNYIFKVRATDDNGVHWYEMAEPVSVHIQTPFFKTFWFYLLLTVAVIAIISFIFYSWHHAYMSRIITALKIRNAIASDLHDDIGSSLSSIMVMSELAKKRDDYAKEYFDAIKENAGKIIENMNDIVWAVNPGNDTMDQILARMQQFASSLLEKKDIQLHFNACSSLSSVKLTMAERKNFYLIFKEAIHNAFKYASCNKVTVEITRSARKISMIIKDDGKGFDVTKKYAGNGLNNLKKRTKEINGKIEISSGCNKETTLMLAFKPTHKGS